MIFSDYESIELFVKTQRIMQKSRNRFCRGECALTGECRGDSAGFGFGNKSFQTLPLKTISLESVKNKKNYQ